MPDADPPFEVPPEYADVYESAFRRASDEDAGTSTGSGSGGDRREGPRAGRRRRRVLVGLALAVVVAGVAVVVGLLLAQQGGQQESADRSRPVERDRSAVPSTAVQPSSAASTCRAPTVTGADSRAESFAPGNAVDSDSATSWGCDGRAVGAELVLRMPAETRIDRVGLLPTTEVSGLSINRVAVVTWTFDDGTSLSQDLSPSAGPVVALMDLPSTRTTRTVRLRLTAVAPGPVDITAVSSVFLSGPP